MAKVRIAISLDTTEIQLAHEPTREGRNKKPIFGLAPLWEHVEPIWELRIGEYRVFYVSSTMWMRRHRS